MRLDKFLSETMPCTRSEAKRLIRIGAVAINGQAAKKPEEKVDENKDAVCVHQKQLVYAPFVYYMFHKPAGCVTATEDSRHKTVMDYLKEEKRKDLFPVGRLDIDTEGLLLITNDGALAHELLSPAKHVPKTYFARVRGQVSSEDADAFAAGVDIGEKKPTKPAKLVIVTSAEISEIMLTITEGKFHQVKRMFAARGKEVVYLKRVSMGALRLPEDLAPGAYRPLTAEELQQLK